MPVKTRAWTQPELDILRRHHDDREAAKALSQAGYYRQVRSVARRREVERAKANGGGNARLTAPDTAQRTDDEQH